MNKPNIIWFVVDQMRGQAMGINGDPNVFTPNLNDDPCEQNNLVFHSHLSGKRREMRALLEEWAGKTGDELIFIA